MITRVHHVGVVVRDLDGAVAFWRDALGLPVVRTAELPDQGVRGALLACGACEIELLEPTASETGVARFLARRGEGLHHLCFESDDVAREVERLAAIGAEMIDRVPRKGLAGMIAFLHPRACAGILVEVATPLDHASLPAAPLAVQTVHLAVEDAPVAARRYGELFELPLASPVDWNRAGVAGPRLAVGGVTIRFDSADASSGQPGLSALRLEASKMNAVAGRLRDCGLPCREDAVGLALGPTVSHGVALVIGQPQAREGRA